MRDSSSTATIHQIIALLSSSSFTSPGSCPGGGGYDGIHDTDESLAFYLCSVCPRRSFHLFVAGNEKPEIGNLCWWPQWGWIFYKDHSSVTWQMMMMRMNWDGSCLSTNKTKSFMFHVKHKITRKWFQSKTYSNGILFHFREVLVHVMINRISFSWGLHRLADIELANTSIRNKLSE